MNHAISQSDFFKLPEVINAQEVQKKNPFGSEAHRAAHIRILNIAKQNKVEQYFESLELYDLPIKK